MVLPSGLTPITVCISCLYFRVGKVSHGRAWQCFRYCFGLEIDFFALVRSEHIRLLPFEREGVDLLTAPHPFGPYPARHIIDLIT